MPLYEIAHDPNRTAEIRELLAQGGDVEELNQAGESALHVAAKHSCVATISLLLEHGAKVNVKDRGGKTPLHVVAMFGNSEAKAGAALALLSAGAPIEAKDAEGATPLFAASTGGNVELATALLDHGANAEVEVRSLRPLHIAAYGARVEMVRLLIGRGADVFAGTDGMTALRHALQVSGDTPYDVGMRTLAAFGQGVERDRYAARIEVVQMLSDAMNSRQVKPPRPWWQFWKRQ